MDYRDKRLRTSIHISEGRKSIVIDTGPDFRQQMLREDVKHLDAVIFTHGHKDHTAGLDDVRAYNFKQNMDMPVFGTRSVHDQIKTEFYYAFETAQYPGIPQLSLREIDRAPFDVAGITFTPLPVMHLHLPVLGFRVGNFSYITDANAIPDETFRFIEGTEILVLNALQKEKHISHFNLQEATAVAQKIGARQTYFTHISHKMGFHKVVDPTLPTGIALAYDGLSIQV
jgi:phosphoribosyl 1,2-cyclic phosphate phosphodiesterase